MVTFSLTGIIWLMQALRFVDFIINRGLSVGDFLYLTILILPALLAIILPISLLIAVIFTYHKLIVESELVVMQASGISRLQLAIPAIIAGLMITAVTYAFTLYLLPTANRQFEDLKSFMRDNYASMLLQEEVFNHPVDGLTVFIQERSDTGKLHGVLVHDNRNPRSIITMMAEDATLVQTPSGPRFQLENGIRQEKRDGQISWLNFESYSMDLSYYTKQKLSRKQGTDELYLTELMHPTLTGDNQLRYASELHRRLVWPWTSLSLSLIAVAFLTTGQFNRRGITKRLISVSALTVASILGFMGLQNMLIKYPHSVPFFYIYALSMIIIPLIAIIKDFNKKTKIKAHVIT